MSRFAPTLRLDITAAQVAELEDAGITIDDAFSKSREFFEQVDMNDKPTFRADTITDIETGVVLHNYQSTVIGKFTIDGDLFIKTGTGDIIKVEFNLI